METLCTAESASQEGVWIALMRPTEQDKISSSCCSLLRWSEILKLTTAIFLTGVIIGVTFLIVNLSLDIQVRLNIITSGYAHFVVTT
jgi:hypothetical protein